MNIATVQEIPRPKYSALFTLLDYLDLSDEKDEVVEKVIISIVRKMFQNSFGDTHRFDAFGVLCIHRYGGYHCTGEADEFGWKRLVIKTNKHNIIVWPKNSQLSFTEQYHASNNASNQNSGPSFEGTIFSQGQRENHLRHSGGVSS